MITAEHLEGWEGACANAAPGPWDVYEHGSDELDEGDEPELCYVEDNGGCPVAERMSAGDAEFIAIAREAMPELVARVRELEAALAAEGFDAFQAQAWARAGEHAKCGDRVAMLYLALGLCGEAGEVGELVKKHAGQGRPLDRAKVVGELGDALWYLAMVAKSVGATLSEVAAAQIAKNHARYPQGFTREAAAARADEGEVCRG